MDEKIQIVQLGNPVLRQKALPVKHVLDIEIQNLIDDLILFVQKVNGVGISAPQVNKSIRLSVIASHPNPRYPYAPYMKPTAVINPRIISRSKDMVKDWEGCLSIPGVRGLVPRHKTIMVEYTNRQGRIIRTEYTDFVARIFQHECDHLEGLVFLDRIENNIDIFSEKEFQRILKDRNRSNKK